MGIKFNLRGSGPTVDDIQSESTRQPSASDAIANDHRRKSVNDQVVASARELPLANLLSLLYSLLSYSSCGDLPMNFWMY